jgi:hypothetical protein
MKPIESNKTGFADLLNSVALPRTFTAVDADEFIDSYSQRIETTRGKIANLIVSLVEQSHRHPNTNEVTIPILQYIHGALNVYRVPSYHENDRFYVYAYNTETKQFNDSGYVIWNDYLGNPNTSIRTAGGYIAVMLSDKGVTWLNDIARSISSRIVSPTT